jgi:hypothetical protein
MGDDNELDVQMQIEETLCKVNFIVDTAWADRDEDDEPNESKQRFINSRDQLSGLLKPLLDGLITPEYAKVELAQIQAALDSQSE